MNSLEQQANNSSLEFQPLATGLLAEAQQLLKQQAGQKSAPEKKHPLLEKALSNPESYTEHLIKLLYERKDVLTKDLTAQLSFEAKSAYRLEDTLELLMNKVIFPKLANSEDFSAYPDITRADGYPPGYFRDFVINILRPAFEATLKHYDNSYDCYSHIKPIKNSPEKSPSPKYTLTDEVKRLDFYKGFSRAASYYFPDRLEKLREQLGYATYTTIRRLNYEPNKEIHGDQISDVIDIAIASLLPDIQNTKPLSSFRLNLDYCKHVLEELEKYFSLIIIAAQERTYLKLLFQSNDMERTQLDARKYTQIYKEQYGKDAPPLVTALKERFWKKRFVKGLCGLKIDQGVKILANLVKFCVDLNETSKIYLSNPVLSAKKKQEAQLLGAISEVMARRLNDLAGELEVRLRIGNINLDKLLEYQGFLSNINSSGASDALLQMVARLESEFQIATEVKEDFKDGLQALNQGHIENGQLPPLTGAESD